MLYFLTYSLLVLISAKVILTSMSSKNGNIEPNLIKNVVSRIKKLDTDNEGELMVIPILVLLLYMIAIPLSIGIIVSDINDYFMNNNGNTVNADEIISSMLSKDQIKKNKNNIEKIKDEYENGDINISGLISELKSM